MSIRKLPLKANGHKFHPGDEVTVMQDGDAPLVVQLGVAGCAVCDKWWPKHRVTETAVEILEPCPYPNGITTTIMLNVPSGKIVVSDDLRPIYNRDFRREPPSYNSVLGQAQAVEEMAAIGCAFGPVLNTSPGLYRTGSDTYVIASVNHDEEGDPNLPEEAMLARICTDLWAYSIADLEHWKSRGGDPEMLGQTDSIVDIAPGTYQFVHHTGELGFDHDAAGSVIFAHIERVGSAT